MGYVIVSKQTGLRYWHLPRCNSTYKTRAAAVGAITEYIKPGRGQISQDSEVMDNDEYMRRYPNDSYMNSFKEEEVRCAQ